jgi:hypothetical protein
MNTTHAAEGRALPTGSWLNGGSLVGAEPPLACCSISITSRGPTTQEKSSEGALTRSWSASPLLNRFERRQAYARPMGTTGGGAVGQTLPLRAHRPPPTKNNRIRPSGAPLSSTPVILNTSGLNVCPFPGPPRPCRSRTRS